MAQHGIKVFFQSQHGSLDYDLQAWLGQVNGQVTIHHIMMDSNQYGHCLVVQYETAPGPRYRARVIYSRRHDGLEAEANPLLVGANPAVRPLIALGSNDYGHCLCMIDAE